MNKYIEYLLKDISIATANVAMPYAEKEWSITDWISEEEEDKTAPVRNLQEWTGITKEMLPPQDMLNDEQLEKVLSALNINDG